MINEQLLEYVQQELGFGIFPIDIKKALLDIGWPAEDIDVVFAELVPTTLGSSTASFAKATKESVSTPEQSLSQSPLVQQRTGRTQEVIKKKTNKAVLFGLTILALVVVGAVGVFGYTYINRQALSPEEVLAKMTQELGRVSSLSYSGNMTMNIALPDMAMMQMPEMGADTEGTADTVNPVEKGETPTPPVREEMSTMTNLQVGFVGKADLRDTDNPKSSTSLEIATNLFSLWQGMAGLSDEGVETESNMLHFGLDTKTIGTILYTQLRTVPMSPIMGLDLSLFRNQWMQFNQGFVLPINNIIDMLLPITITKTLPDDIIEGVATHHYTFSLKKETLQLIEKQMTEISNEETFTKMLTTANTENMLVPMGELWIGKKDFLPYRMTIDIVLPATNVVSTTGNISIDVSFKDFNTSITITEPTEVKTPQELTGAIIDVNSSVPNISIEE